jgi:hypothetical protein
MEAIGIYVTTGATVGANMYINNWLVQVLWLMWIIMNSTLLRSYSESICGYSASTPNTRRLHLGGFVKSSGDIAITAPAGIVG